MDDTIAAVSTPIGEGGIGIVRMSGKRALSIADKIFKSKDKLKPSKFKSYTTHYGFIVDPRCSILDTRCKDPGSRIKDQRVIDEVILTVMKAPKSYTKENIVEINCHSGIVPLKKTLDLIIRLGARLAEPGEFTKRAFLNGRIDLTQAEAVLNIIEAKTEMSLENALSQLQGKFSSTIYKIRGRLLKMLINIEAFIDFPEEDLEIDFKKDISKGLDGILDELNCLLETAEYGRILNGGITAVICGKPNAGKSSLMNAILRENRCIVTPIPGTTRDTIEEFANIKGIPIKLVDTAGITKKAGFINEASMRRAEDSITNADIVIFVLDANRQITKEDLKIKDLIKNKKTLVVLNKIDLKRKAAKKDIDRLGVKNIVQISAVKKTGIDALEKEIYKKVWHKTSGNGFDRPFVSNARQKEALQNAFNNLKNGFCAMNDSVPIEFASLDIRSAVDELGRIVGKITTEDILDGIFSKFCIGK